MAPVASTTKRIDIAIKGKQSAYVGLSTHPYETDDFYEIVIGGSSGTQSAIRRCGNCPNLVQLKLAREHFLSSGEFRSFWVKWDNGVISVGRSEESEPFMTWEDEDPLPVRFVRFHGSTAHPIHMQMCNVGM